MFTTFSVHYKSITKYKFGRPATDGYLFYETCVTSLRTHLVDLTPIGTLFLTQGTCTRILYAHCILLIRITIVPRSLCNLSSAAAAATVSTKVSSPSPRPPRRRSRVGEERRGEERRGERVSPLREPPLDGVHVHQLSVVVDEEEEEWYSPCEIVLLFYFCSAVQSVTDGRRWSELGREVEIPLARGRQTRKIQHEYPNHVV